MPLMKEYFILSGFNHWLKPHLPYNNFQSKNTKETANSGNLDKRTILTYKFYL